GPHGTAKGSGADPKDRLPLLLRYEEALNLLAAKHTDAAIRQLRGILAVDPDNLLVRRDLGVALIEGKAFEKAIPELQQVAGAASWAIDDRLNGLCSQTPITMTTGSIEVSSVVGASDMQLRSGGSRSGTHAGIERGNWQIPAQRQFQTGGIAGGETMGAGQQ